MPKIALCFRLLQAATVRLWQHHADPGSTVFRQCAESSGGFRLHVATLYDSWLLLATLRCTTCMAPVPKYQNSAIRYLRVAQHRSFSCMFTCKLRWNVSLVAEIHFLTWFRMLYYPWRSWSVAALIDDWLTLAAPRSSGWSTRTRPPSAALATLHHYWLLLLTWSRGESFFAKMRLWTFDSIYVHFQSQKNFKEIHHLALTTISMTSRHSYSPTRNSWMGQTWNPWNPQENQAFNPERKPCSDNRMVCPSRYSGGFGSSLSWCERTRGWRNRLQISLPLKMTLPSKENWKEEVRQKERKDRNGLNQRMYSTILRTKHYMLNLQNMLTAEKPTLYVLLQESKNSELIQRRNIEFYYERQ